MNFITLRSINSIMFPSVLLLVVLLIFSIQPSDDIEFQTMKFNEDSLPKQCRFEGELLGGTKWRDANGENFLIISQNFKTGVDAGIQEIFGYNYVIKDSNYHLLWKWYDESENSCEIGEGLIGQIQIEDVDGDGIGESAFIYNIEGVCDLSPRLFTLVFHSDTTSLTIHGTNRIQIDDTTTRGGEIQTDSTFGAAPIEFGDFCTSLWQRTFE
ncbi:MAG: hypothetical protein IPM69_00075 [Ignavibacteria bacterium]|nr:hypothetical protein [Ignavibacteria bacterium]